MKIDIPSEVIDDLRDILVALEQAADQHKGFHDTEELIESWTPSGADENISCPDLTVGLVRKAERVKKLLRL